MVGIITFVVLVIVSGTSVSSMQWTDIPQDQLRRWRAGAGRQVVASTLAVVVEAIVIVIVVAEVVAVAVKTWATLSFSLSPYGQKT